MENPLEPLIQSLGLPKTVSHDKGSWEGGLSVMINGPQAGHWKHWGSGQQGQDLVSLYGAIHQVDSQRALQVPSSKTSVGLVEPLKTDLPQAVVPVVQQNRVRVTTDRSTPLKSQDQISVLRQALEDGKSSKSMAATGPASQKDVPKILRKAPKKDIELER